MPSAEIEKPQPGLLEALRRKIVLYSLAYTLAALLTISLLSILPMIGHLKRSEDAHLLQAARAKALAVNENLARISDITRQITSRSAIREQLAEFRRGRIDRASLQQFTAPKLADALIQSEEVAGITRLDPEGGILVEVGTPIPEAFRQAPGPESRDVHLSAPLEIDGRLYLLTGSPILDPELGRIGTDLVLFATMQLQRILHDWTALGETGDCLLGRMSDGEPEIFFPGRRGRVQNYAQLAAAQSLRKAFSDAYAQGSGTVRCLEESPEAPALLAYAPIEETGWALVVSMSQDELYHPVYRLLSPVAGTVLLLTMLCGAGMLLLLRPLTGQVLVYSSSLEQLNRALRDEVTERRRAVEKLRRSEHEWTQTFEAIADAVAILDTGGNLLRMNRAAAAFFGHQGLHQKSEAACRMFFGLERPQKACPFHRMLESGQTEYGELYEPHTERYFQIACYPLTDEQGELWGGVHVAQDITEQKRMEHAKDEMLSAVSHEMRTPLTAMLGFTEFLIENEVEREQQLDFLGTVLKETERLNELITNFLDLQRLQSELETYHFEALEVGGMLQEVAHLFAVASKKHRITLDCPASLPAVRGDLKRLEQVLKNLLSNAIKYSPRGGTVHLRARVQHDCVLLSVSDEGIGIPPQALNKIFTRFYRVDDSDRRIPGGIGLGLALVKEVVTAHRGRVWAESTLGAGSTFYFTLPIWLDKAA
ncbi:hypothetical protein DESUT3_30760 [Desulfuromonas versatilis]|uniref:histidine kinase n=1 Tax=Desulfuromonas versatilis TaxID=2802975 RepID=A0ABM8HYZ1_9BACT|nr:ATP-binding protein [Desulfuromonas versatilis]BCR06007.1 hypothetical protein DESUT3_30760 [Desulfuromonas versatilis]